MKNLKKLAAVLLALIMLCSFASAVSAEEATGSITVNNAVSGETYTAYRIFDLESYSGTNYAYKLNSARSGFTNEGFNVTDGCIEMTDGFNAAEFAAAAIAYWSLLRLFC